MFPFFFLHVSKNFTHIKTLVLTQYQHCMGTSVGGPWANSSIVPILYQFQHQVYTCLKSAKNQSLTKYHTEPVMNIWKRTQCQVQTPSWYENFIKFQIPGSSWYVQKLITTPALAFTLFMQWSIFVLNMQFLHTRNYVFVVCYVITHFSIMPS
jgi:hypothetical protein